MISICVSAGQSVELTISGRSIVLYGDAVTLTCNGDTGLTWSGDDSGWFSN